MNGQRGFTLIELLIVLAVSMIGLAGVLSLFTTTKRGNALAQEGAEAVEIAEETLEGFRAMPVSAIEAIPNYGNISSDRMGPVPHHHGPIVGQRGVVFRRLVQAVEVPGSGNLVRLSVTVQWGDDDAGGREPSTDHAVTLEVVRNRQVPL